MSTTLINSFEVPLGKEEEFLQGWQAVAEYMQKAPGFLSARLHRSLDPQAMFRFVNIVEWESPQHFQAATRSEVFQRMSRQMPWVAHPFLYQVVTELAPSSPE